MFEESLLRVVKERRAGRYAGGDHPDAREILRVALELLTPALTDDQASTWYGGSWIDSGTWIPVTRGRLETLAEKLAPCRYGKAGGLSIARRNVFECRGKPVDLFLAAMAWGFGPRGYGWSRTAKMINPDGKDGEASVEAAVAAYCSAWHRGGAAAVARAWTSGPGKIWGLGPAFASKAAYFALYERENKNGPLIADLNTAWSAWALGGIWDSRYDAEKYAEYVDWCQRWAYELECRSDDIERALFRMGPQIRKMPR